MGPTKPQAFSSNVNVFIEQMSVKQMDIKHDHLHSGTRPREKNTLQLIRMQYGDTLNADIGTENEHQNSVFEFMKKLNKITTLLIQQQCLSSLPKRQITVFDGDPIKYYAFIKA